MKPVHLPGFGAGIGYAELARIRHALTRELTKADANREPVSADLRATITMIDDLGAAWETRKTVSSEVSKVDDASLPPLEWTSMKHASQLLGISTQAVGRLRDRGSLHAESDGRGWRICLESVHARKDGHKCPH